MLFSSAIFLWGVLLYVTVFERAALSKANHAHLYYLYATMGGMALGVFAVLLFGGGFIRLLKRPSTTSSTPEQK